MGVIWIDSGRFSGAASILHPEVQNWNTRVIANGGTASSGTLDALSTFCAAIDAGSGLRAAITRLNLFCGDNLNACLVPLYLAESSGAQAKGNITDINNNFVSGDYAASGASGGLTGNGTTKFLNTGLPQNEVGSSTSSHLSLSGTSLPTNVDAVALGSFNGAAASIDDINLKVGGNTGVTYRSGILASSSIAPASSYVHLVGTRNAGNTSAVLYSSGVFIGSNALGASISRTTRPYFIFALNNAGTAAGIVGGRLRMYSIGSTLTAAQILAFSNAVSAFNVALGRN
jgi:hypothetical protein